MKSFLTKFTHRRTAYLPVGLAVTSVTVAAVLLGWGGRSLARFSSNGAFMYALVTGALLILSMSWQWRLYFARRSRKAAAFQRADKNHRWAGIIPIGLLTLHIGGPGGTLLAALSYGLLVSCISGLFNPEILRPKHPFNRSVWLWTHVVFAAAIIPIAILHIWAVFAFKGP